MFQSSNISPRCLTAWHTYWKIRKSLKQEQTSSHYPQYKPVKGPPVLPGLAQVPCLPLKIHLSSRPSENLHTALHPEQREQKEQGESRGRARRWSGWAEFRIIDLFTQWLINKKVLPINCKCTMEKGFSHHKQTAPEVCFVRSFSFSLSSFVCIKT